MQTRPVDAAAVFESAARHLVTGVAERQRTIGAGGVEIAAAGTEVQLSNGKTVLDFGSYAVTLFGHRPAPVVRAVHEAIDVMPTTTRLLANPYPAILADKLVSATGSDRLSKVWFGLNGADVVEAVLKLALARTGRPRLLAVEGGFHGKSMGALAATSDAERRKPVQGFLGDVRHIALEADAVARAAAEGPFAAIIIEPVQGEGGGRILPPELLRRWSADAHSAGAFVIADEIQCGLYRCGSMSVALSAGMDVDAVLFGKALGGGVMPLSASVCSADLFSPLIEDPYFHTATFSGHPACCAAGIAALDLLETITGQITAAAGLLAEGIVQIGERHPDVVVAVRSAGVFGVLECASPVQSGLLTLEAGRRGLLLAQCLTAPSVVRLLPPGVVTEQQMESAMSILDAACASVCRRTIR